MLDSEKKSLNLFVYGTLQPDRAPEEIRAAVSRLRQVGGGTVRGRILHFDSYPGLVLDESAEQVPGIVLEAPDSNTLRDLDQYEEYLPGDPAGSLFVRSRASVLLNDGKSLDCWVYVYNRAAA